MQNTMPENQKKENLSDDESENGLICWKYWTDSSCQSIITDIFREVCAAVQLLGITLELHYLIYLKGN